MRTRFGWGTVLLVPCALAAAAPGPASRSNPRAEVGALIEQLPQVTDEVVCYSAAYAYEGNPFWPLRYTGPADQREEAKSTRSPVLHRLVGYGVDALPLLLSHLTDERRAKTSIGGGNASACFGDQYDARFQDPGRQPRGVNRKEEDRPSRAQFPGYTLRVGDLCFSAVGQIVNRQLYAVNARPGYVVNSPLERPALARAVRQDWGGLSRISHQQSLIDDVVRDQRYVWDSAPDALERLCFYYPAAAERLTVRLLSRPVDDSQRVDDFIEKELLPHDDPDDWKRNIARFRVENGERYGVMVFRRLAIRYAANPVAPELGGPAKAQKERAQAILRRVYPGESEYRPPFAPVSNSSDALSAIRASMLLRSQRVDEVVLEVFRSVAARQGKYAAAAEPEVIAMACIDRLAGRKWDAGFAAYCRQRIRELEAGERTPRAETVLDRLREKLAVLMEGSGHARIDPRSKQ